MVAIEKLAPSRHHAITEWNAEDTTPKRGSLVATNKQKVLT